MKPSCCDFTNRQVQQVSPCWCLYSLIIQQWAAMISTLMTGWKVLKELVVTCKKVNLVSKMNSSTILPLPCNLLTCNNAPNALDPKCSKVPEDQKLVDVTEGLMLFFFMCHCKIWLDLFLQLMPVINIMLCFWLGSTCMLSPQRDYRSIMWGTFTASQVTLRAGFLMCITAQDWHLPLQCPLRDVLCASALLDLTGCLISLKQ